MDFQEEIRKEQRADKKNRKTHFYLTSQGEIRLPGSTYLILNNPPMIGLETDYSRVADRRPGIKTPNTPLARQKALSFSTSSAYPHSGN
jgi:hypothetical protein